MHDSGRELTRITNQEKDPPCATGTFAGEMILPDGNVIAPTGKAFDLTFATTAKWDGDRMIEEYVFWDSALQAQQIGLT